MSADVLENEVTLFSIEESDINIIRCRHCFFSLCLKIVRGDC